MRPNRLENQNNRNRKSPNINEPQAHPTKNSRKSLEQGARRINRKARQYMRARNFSWYVLFVPSQKEYIAQKIISQAIARENSNPDVAEANNEDTVHVYLPIHTRWRRENRYSRKKTQFSFPTIPGCLFIGVQKGAQIWFELLNLHIVFGVMRIDEEPVQISGRDLEQFIVRNRQAREGQKTHCSPSANKPMSSGDDAKIVNGPFRGSKVNIHGIEGQNAKILLEFMGGNHLVEIALDHLQDAS